MPRDAGELVAHLAVDVVTIPFRAIAPDQYQTNKLPVMARESSALFCETLRLLPDIAGARPDEFVI
jgi:hypothetical protein